MNSNESGALPPSVPKGTISPSVMRHILEWHGFHATPHAQSRFLETMGEDELRALARDAAPRGRKV